MKASDLIAKKISQYTDYVFSGQGGSVVHILDSLYKRNDVKILLKKFLLINRTHQLTLQHI